MSFNEMIENVSSVLTGLGIRINSNDYDGVLIKQLRSSNTLDENRTTNQTHIALTGAQMDIFPFLSSYGYFESDYSERNEALKKYFIVRVPFVINEVNYQYLLDNTTTSNPTPITDFDDTGNKKIYSCVFRSRRNDAADQTQWSLLDKDDAGFINFRKIINANDYVVVLKVKNKFMYSIFAIKEDDAETLEEFNNKFDILNTATVVDIDNLVNDDTNEQFIDGQNVLFYGVPGTGKSYRIKQTYHPTIDNSERVVFHPDYTYSDFVGQILPETKKDDNGNDIILYPFTPGPFTRILKKASKEENKDKPFYLIIEEINRGNAPAIFGEIFQLLDRCDETDKADDPSVNIGESAYSINNADIAKEVYGDAQHPVKIPSNLFILATMNTADQNVFTLDTAFKRRWKMKHINNDVYGCDHAQAFICNRNVKWADFATKINNKIIECSDGNLGAEDNRLGAYFVKENELKDTSDFAEKVLMYLWNDAFKYDRDKVFKAAYCTLDQVIEAFENPNVGFGVFVDDFNFDNSSVDSVMEDIKTDSIEEESQDRPAAEYLANKSKQLAALYDLLFEKIHDSIPETKAYTTNGLNYIGLSSEKVKNKKNFADLAFKTDHIVINCKSPTSDFLRNIGEELKYDGHHNHYFKFDLYKANKIDEAVKIIIESYNQLKQG